jgi:peptidoglycan hydrolase-like protein with peptidoglycan-binding domain
MLYSLTWLPDVLERVGLKVAEVPEWRSRGRAQMGQVRGVMVHHTGGARVGNMPSLDLLVRGRPDLSGPLAQLGLGRDGTFYVIAAGRCNHAGAGKWRGVTTGNSSFIGIECENTGKADDPWPDVQMDALRRGAAAILAHVGTDASMACGHKEYALPSGRKPDPLWEVAPFRESIAQLISRGVPAALPIPARDAMLRPTLRRGAVGELVTLLQTRLGVEAIGQFGPKTEAAVRSFQRAHNSVPDGIVGPKTWELIDTQGGNAAAGATPRAEVTQNAAADARVKVPSDVPAVAPPPMALPPVDDPQHPVRIVAPNVLTPSGQRFARQFKLGFMTLGTTTVAAALAADPAAGADIAPARLAIIAALSGNEGQLEAVNSWDAAFMSFGIMQWTVGQAAGQGELAALLAVLKRADAGAFAECFGQLGIDVEIAARATTGFLALNGRRLDSSSAKSVLRSPEWAYRFWRAGNHPAVRRAEIRHAASRIDRISDIDISGHPLRAWLSSQLGMALVLDEHVNRPGHVPATIAAALTATLATDLVSSDPAEWDEAIEHRLIERYLTLRSRTNMTHSLSRGQRLLDTALRGEIASNRGSFA